MVSYGHSHAQREMHLAAAGASTPLSVLQAPLVVYDCSRPCLCLACAEGILEGCNHRAGDRWHLGHSLWLHGLPPDCDIRLHVVLPPVCSVSRWPGVHLHPAQPWGRSQRLRDSSRALVASAVGACPASTAALYEKLLAVETHTWVCVMSRGLTYLAVCVTANKLLATCHEG